MYRVLIVEDEAPSREGLSELIGQKKDIYLTATAVNGYEGLHMVQNFQPDIIITDIRMPVLDGLSMLRTLKESGCEAETLLLTGYAEFQYAQSAIQIGVKDYILKPVVPKTIFEKLQRCAEFIEKRKFSEENTEPSVFPLAFPDDAKKLLHHFPLLTDYIAAVFYPVRENKEISPLLDYCRKNGPLTLFKPSLSNHIGVIIPCGDISRLHRLQKQPFWNPQTICCYMGSDRPDELFQNAEELMNHLKWSVSLGKNCFSLSECTSLPCGKTEANPVYAQIKMLFRNQEYSACCQKAEDLLMCFLEKGCSPEVILRHLAACILRYPPNTLHMLGMDEEICYAQAVSSLLDARTLEEIRNVLQAYYMLGSNVLRQHPAAYSKPVMLAMKEIESNYHQVLSLNFIAQSIGITPQYLSRIFVKETGKNFSDYITGYRIEKAKKLMQNTDLKIYEISEKVGYPDVKYFSTLFKKITGESPNSYRYNQ